MMKMNQKIVLYNQILMTVEYDKGMSEGMVRAIRRGEENWGGMGIGEKELVRQTEEMLKKLEEEKDEDAEEGDNGTGEAARMWKGHGDRSKKE